MKHFLLVVLYLFLVSLGFSQTVSLLGSQTRCVGVQTLFEPQLNGISKQTVQSYFWRFGTGDSIMVTPSGHPDGVVNYTYYTPGLYNLQLRLTFSNRQPLDTQFLIVVNSLPQANFDILTQDSQCFNSHVFTVQNFSIPGNFPSSPITKVILDWGDSSPITLEGGNLSLFLLSKKFAQFKSNYSIKLTAIDSFSCASSISKSVFLAPAYPITFNLSGGARCDSSDYIFIPTVSIPKQELNYFRWDFGDGTYYGSKIPPDNQDSIYLKSFSKRYYANGLFYPKFLVKYNQLGCLDSVQVSPGSSNIPENIHLNIELKLKLPNSSNKPDSICSGTGYEYIYMYNKYPIRGSKNQVFTVWNMANGMGFMSYSYDVDTVWLNYKNKLGQYFPSLEVNCPNSPTRIYYYYSRIDTVSSIRANWPAPTSSVSLNSIKGKIFSSIDSISHPLIYQERYGNQISVGIRPNSILALHNHNLIAKEIRFVNVGGISSGITLNQIYKTRYINDSLFQLESSSSNQLISFTSSSNIPPIIQQVFRNYDSFASNWDFLKSVGSSNQTKIPVSKLRGYGIQILGPSSMVESPETNVKINALQSNQCSNSLPVEFTNSSSAYLSNDVFNLWDFDDEFAPACTSFSVPKAGFGFPPYTNANDLKTRTNPWFWSNGKIYQGAVNCRYSYDSLPIHKYENWNLVYNWFVNGHDFPPYDTSKWTTNQALVTWPGNPNGKRLVHPLDTATWNKPIYSAGPFPARIDTMQIWPEDINPGKSIVTVKSIPDPIAHSKGLYKTLIPAGTLVPISGPITPTSLGTFPDGQARNYSGNQTVSGGRSFYRYVFDRAVQHCFNVKLKQKDSVNHAAGKGSSLATRFNLVGNTLEIPEYQNGILIRMNTYTQGAQIKNNKFYFKGPDSISIQQDSAGSFAMVSLDYRFLDAEDCGSEAITALPLMKPDAFGAVPVGNGCYGYSSYSPSGINFLGANANAGIGPNCGKRTFLYLNYDSLADRNDVNLVWNGKNTRCLLDAFFDFNGINPLTGTNTSPGGYQGMPFYSSSNINPNFIWQNPNGSVHYPVYFNPETPNWIMNSSLKPADKDGFVTIGIIVGTGYTNSSLVSPECTSDTIWYHNFFHFTSLDPQHYFDNADTVQNYLLANPNLSLEQVSNPNYLSQFNYLYPAKFQPGKPERNLFSIRPKLKQQKYIAVRTIGYTNPFNRNYDNLIIDSIFSNSYDTLVQVNLPGSPGQFEWRLFPRHSFPYLKKRYWITKGRVSGSYQIDSIRVNAPSTRFLDIVKLDTSWRCEDPNHVLAPLSIAKSYYRFDSSFHEPLEIVKFKESRITQNQDPIERIECSFKSTSGCTFGWAIPYVCGAMDTFTVRNASNSEASVFCEGETIRLRDSVFYFFPNEDKSDYSNIFGFYSPSATILDTTNYFRRPYLLNISDSIRVRPNFRNYFVLPGNQTCPTGYVGVPFSLSSKTGVKCMKRDTFYMERILWDINSDGIVDRVGPNPTINGLNPGNYTIRLITRDSMGNWDTCSRAIVVSSRAKIGVLPDTINAANTDSVFLNGPSGFMSYLWSNGSTTKSTWVKAIGKYILAVQDSSGCTKADSVYVNFFRKATPSDTLICSGSSVWIRSNIFPSQKIRWWNGDSTDKVLVSPDSTRYFSFVISNNGISKRDSVIIRVKKRPILSLPDTLVFVKNNFPLFKGEKGYFYAFNNLTRPDSFYLNLPGNAFIRKTDSVGCSVTDTFTLLRRISLATKDTTICQGDAITLKMDTIGTGNYQWYNDTLKASYSAFFNQNTTISASITLGSFTFKDSAIIQLVPKPIINLLDTFWFVDSDSVRINAGPAGNSYRLNGAIKDSVFWIKTPGNYTISSRNSALCESSKQIKVIQLSSIPLANYATCKGSEIQISLPNPATSSRVWSFNQDTSAVFKFTPDSSFWLYCTFRNGSFTLRDSAWINVNPPPIIPVPDSLICFDVDSFKFTFPTKYQYEWSNGKVGNEIFVSNTNVVNLTIRDSNSCLASKQVQLIKLPGLFSKSIDSICVNDTIFVQIPQGNFKVYYNNSEINSSIYPIKIVRDSLLKFEFKLGSFWFTDSLKVYSKALPSNVVAKWPDKSCLGDTVFIQASQENSLYQWFRNDSLLIGKTGSLLKTNVTGIYTCVIQGSNSCRRITNPENVQFNSMPNTRIFSWDLLRVACENEQDFQFESRTNPSVPIVNRFWYLNGIAQPANSVFIPGKLNPGIYSVKLIAQSDSACQDADSLAIQVLESPKITTIIGDTTPMVNIPSTYKIDSIFGASYFWNMSGATILSGSGTSSIEVMWPQPGLYTIAVVVKLGECSSTVQKYVNNLNNSIPNRLGISDFILAPNPATEAISLFHANGESFEGSIEIRDQHGRTVKLFTIPTPVSIFKMPIENLAPAIYHVHFRSKSNRVKTFMFLKHN